MLSNDFIRNVTVLKNKCLFVEFKINRFQNIGKGTVIDI